jgi:hypothetical protein
MHSACTVQNCASNRQTGKRNIVTTLSAVIAPDPDVTAWVASVRARFPGCRPLWGRSHLGEIGRQP